MALIEWSALLETGDPTVDSQHRELIQLVDRLHGVAHGTDSGVGVGEALQKLADHTVSHFQHEERLMVASAYPDYVAHRAEHQALVNKTTELLTGFQSGKLTLPVTLSRFLIDWIHGHIRQCDQKMISYVREHKKAA